MTHRSVSDGALLGTGISADADRFCGEAEAVFTGRLSPHELTHIFVAGLEEARKQEGAVDARHIIGQLSEGIRRRAQFSRRRNDDPDLEEMNGYLRASRAARLAPPEEASALLRHLESAEPPALPRRDPDPSVAGSNIAVASYLFDRPSNALPPGLKLDRAKSVASIDFPERGTTIKFRNHKAVLTFGLPRFGLSYQFQLTSSRMTARRSAFEGGARVGLGAAACALLVAGVLVYALPGLRAMPPQPPRATLEAPTKPTAPKQDVRSTPPMFSVMRVPLFEEKTPVVEPTPAAVPAPGHVATRSTTNIRARPEPGAQVVRVVPGRLILTVFARTDDWVEVGGAEAWGWVPSGYLSPMTGHE